MIVHVLRRQANLETGEQRLAFAVIAQAIGDLGDFVLSGRSSYEPRSAIEFLSSGGEPYASGVGLDPEYVVRIVNTPLGPGEFGVLDLARNKLVGAYSARRELAA